LGAVFVALANGSLSTGTVTVKLFPTQLLPPLAVGTTVYTALSVPPLTFVNVSDMLPVPEADPPVKPEGYVAVHVNVLVTPFVI
jgi:hypothetical protein